MRGDILSSKKNPCPICGRTGGSNSCKTNDERVLCYVAGSDPSCQPLTDAEIGDEHNGYFLAKSDDEWQTWVRQTATKSPRKAQTRVWEYARIGDMTRTPEVQVRRIDAPGEGKQIFQEKLANDFNKEEELADIACQLAPLRSAEVLKRAVQGEPVFLCEGEATADAMREIGLNATTLHKNAPPENLVKAGFKPEMVVVCPDRDQVGIKYAQKVAEVLPGCRFMHAFPGTPEWNGRMPKGGGLDAYDWIEDGATVEDIFAAIVNDLDTRGLEPKGRKQGSAEDLRQAVRRLAQMKLDPQGSHVDREDLIFEEQRVLSTHGINRTQLKGLIIERAMEMIGVQVNHETSVVDIDDDDDGWGDCFEDDDGGDAATVIIPGFAYGGQMTVMAGPSGSGKTEVAVEMTARYINSEPTLPYADIPTECRGKVVWISTDQGAEAREQVKESFQRAGIEPHELRGRVRMVAENSKKGTAPMKATLPHLKRLKDLVEKDQPVCVFLDALRTFCFGTMFDSTSNEDVHMLCVILKGIVCSSGSALVILHHLGSNADNVKPDDFKPEHMASGKTFGQTSDIVYFVRQTEDSSQEEADTHRWMHAVKVRGGTESFTIRFHRDPQIGWMVPLKKDGTNQPEDVSTILSIIAECSPRPISTEDIAKRMQRPRKTIGNKLSALKQYVRIKGRGWVLRSAGRRLLDEQNVTLLPWDEDEDLF